MRGKDNTPVQGVATTGVYWREAAARGGEGSALRAPHSLLAFVALSTTLALVAGLTGALVLSLSHAADEKPPSPPTSGGFDSPRLALLQQAIFCFQPFRQGVPSPAPAGTVPPLRFPAGKCEELVLCGPDGSDWVILQLGRLSDEAPGKNASESPPEQTFRALLDQVPGLAEVRQSSPPMPMDLATGRPVPRAELLPESGAQISPTIWTISGYYARVSHPPANAGAPVRRPVTLTVATRLLPWRGKRLRMIWVTEMNFRHLMRYITALGKASQAMDAP
ncbi:hypothetical protein DB346_13205 [Verrucomicrobia bacterium LW23]|nr:hypothetical protein DB346_13205 [Verrucomicrobia bacterium LW23]